jgi:hypothetical protein
VVTVGERIDDILNHATGTSVEDNDAGGESESLFHVMGDEKDRFPCSLPNASEMGSD